MNFVEFLSEMIDTNPVLIEAVMEGYREIFDTLPHPNEQIEVTLLDKDPRKEPEDSSSREILDYIIQHVGEFNWSIDSDGHVDEWLGTADIDGIPTIVIVPDGDSADFVTVQMLSPNTKLADVTEIHFKWALDEVQELLSKIREHDTKYITESSDFDYSAYVDPKNYAFWKDIAYLLDDNDKKWKLHSVDMLDGLAYCIPFDLDISHDDYADDRIKTGYTDQIKNGTKNKDTNMINFYAYSKYDHPLTFSDLYLEKKASDI